MYFTSGSREGGQVTVGHCKGGQTAGGGHSNRGASVVVTFNSIGEFSLSKFKPLLEKIPNPMKPPTPIPSKKPTENPRVKSFFSVDMCDFLFGAIYFFKSLKLHL
jgi:hypothetical protein